MGTQTAIAEQIVTQGGDYVLALKGNQGRLFESVQQRFETVLSQESETGKWDFYETTDVGHGRKRRGDVGAWEVLKT